MMSSWTPGPWWRGENGGVYAPFEHVYPGKENTGTYGGVGILNATYKDGSGRPNAKANETLAAAAPDMFQALQEMIREHNYMVGGTPCQFKSITQARAALSKARGIDTTETKTRHG